MQSFDGGSGISHETVYDVQGRVTDVQQRQGPPTPAGGVAAPPAPGTGALLTGQHLDYHGDTGSTDPYKRGRLRRTTQGGALETTYDYESAPNGVLQVTVVDTDRKVTTVTTYDAWDRVIALTITDGEFGSLANEKMAYDASGRLVYTSRQQAVLGEVASFSAYDPLGRLLKIRTTQNDVLGAPDQSLVETTDYSLGTKTISSTDPYVDGQTPKAQVVTQLDSLGRTKRVERRSLSSGSTVLPLVRIMAYDSHGQSVYQSDGVRNALLIKNDSLGRPIASVASDQLQTSTTWDGWDQATESKQLGAGGVGLIAHTKNFYTPNGTLEAVNERVERDPNFPDAGRARHTRYSWNLPQRINGVRIGELGSMLDDELPATADTRTWNTTYDVMGRVTQESYGAGQGGDDGIDIRLHDRIFEDFQGPVAKTIRDVEPKRGSAQVAHTITVDGLGRVRTSTDGGYLSTLTFDEAGNATKTVPPAGVGQTDTTFDGRGLPIAETRAGSGTVRRLFDAQGMLRSYKDELGKETTYTTDDLGRVTRIAYPDGATEEIRYDGAGQISAKKNRNGVWFAYTYDAGGRIIRIDQNEVPDVTKAVQAVEYDSAKRVYRIANKDAAVQYESYDLFGRPLRTTTYRYKDHTGLNGVAGQVWLDVHRQEHHWSAFDGERTSWTMPVAGDPASVTNSAPWLTKIDETRDASTALTSLSADAGAASISATAGGVGRITSRSRTGGSASLTTSYGYADSSSIASPYTTGSQLVTGMLRRAETSVGGVRRAGSETYRDGSRRLGDLADLGLAGRVSTWTYDARGRVDQSKLLEDQDDLLAATPIADHHTAAEFRDQRGLTPVLGGPDHAALGYLRSLTVEPAPWTSGENNAHAIVSRTIDRDGQTGATVTYTNEDSARTKTDLQVFDESGDPQEQVTWAYQYDDLQHLVAKESAARRIEYVYDPNGRIVGRHALAGSPGNWIADSDAFTHDGLPASTTWIWDPVTDRLLAIYEEGASGSPDAGLVRQYLHGDRGYDDPVEIIARSSSGAAPQTYFPILDEAGSGSLQAVVGSDGNLIERVLYGDSFGDAPRYLQGAVVDRVTFTSTRDAAGKIDSADVRVHFSESLEPSTVANGARLAAVKANDAYVLAAPDPALDGDDTDNATLLWHFTGDQWNDLVTAAGAEKLEVAITATLRAKGWGNARVQQAPDWAATLYGVRASAAAPVILRQQFTTLATLSGDGNEAVLYRIRNLYMAALETSKTRLLTDFHGYPFREPADGTVYARARWYDLSTGSFLTPDAIGYGDSSNAYAFCANDPVNCSDPLGTESIRKWFGADKDIEGGSYVKGYAKKTGYFAWNVLTFGFLGRHDEAFEEYERTGDQDAYLTSTAVEVGRAAVVGFLTHGAGGFAGGTSATLGGAILRGAGAGAATGVGSTLVEDAYDRLTGGPGMSRSDYLTSAAVGAVFGAIGGAGSFKPFRTGAPVGFDDAAAYEAEWRQMVNAEKAATGRAAVRHRNGNDLYTIVLGHYTNLFDVANYVAAANRLKAHRFEMPSLIYDALTNDAKWLANRKTLDRGIARNARFLLKSPLKDAAAFSSYDRELSYLLNRGYGLSHDATELIRIRW